MFNIFKDWGKSKIFAPVNGTTIELTEVPDKAFSQKLLGEGVAIEPEASLFLAPCEGEVVHIAETKHALGINTEEGVQVLIHIGLDTVKLDGRGFKVLVKEGEKVKKGAKIVELDLEYLKENAPSILSPIVLTNKDKIKDVSIETGKQKAGEDVIMRFSLKD